LIFLTEGNMEREKFIELEFQTLREEIKQTKDRFAFKNYFSDTSDFITRIEDGCQILSGKKIVRAADIKI